MSFPIIAPSQYMHYLIVLILYVSDIDQTEDRSFSRIALCGGNERTLNA